MLDMIQLKEEAKKGYTIIKRDNGIIPTIYSEKENLNYSSRVMGDFLNNLDDLMNQNDNKESNKRKFNIRKILLLFSSDVNTNIVIDSIQSSLAKSCRLLPHSHHMYIKLVLFVQVFL